tara:strand:+ start:3875 stop:10273 length:6399 start_codon:yes stop_codon:yes gene_type:complete
MACRYPPAGEILSSAGGDYTAAAESLLDYIEDANRVVGDYLDWLERVINPTYGSGDWDPYEAAVMGSDDGAGAEWSGYFTECEWIFSNFDPADVRYNPESVTRIMSADDRDGLVCWFRGNGIKYDDLVSLASGYIAFAGVDEEAWLEIANGWDSILHLSDTSAKHFLDCLAAGRDCETCSEIAYGCTDPAAINWNDLATFDDGSCVFLPDPGDASAGGSSDPAAPGFVLIDADKCIDETTPAIIIETYQTCTPNPEAPVPNWLNQTEEEPFLNQKTCEYSIVMLADPPDCSEEYLNTFIEPAVRKLLEYYNKEELAPFTDAGADSPEVEISSLEALRAGSGGLYLEGLQFVGTARKKDFYIPPRPLARTKVLITVGAEEFNRIPEKSELYTQGTPASVPFEGSPSYAVFQTKEIFSIFNTVSRNMRFFEVPYAEWNLETGKTIKGLNLTSEANRIEKFYKELILLLEESDYSFYDLETVEVGFDKNFKVEYIKAKEPYRPPVTLEKGFQSFVDRTPMTNATVMAYISRLPDMRDDLLAREPILWYDFLKKYRHPEIEELYVDDLSSPIIEGNEGVKALSEAACPAGSSAYEPKKTAGEWALAHVNSIKDALMAELREDPCILVDAKILEERNREDLAMQVIDMTLKEYLSSDRIINDLPEQIVYGQWDDIEALYAGMLNNLGYCGIIDLVKSAIDCLLNALGYDDSITIIVGATVRGMSNAEFAKFLAGMPEPLQDVLIAAVRESAPQLMNFLQSLITVTIVDDDGEVIKAAHDRGLAYSYTSVGSGRITGTSVVSTSTPTFFGQANGPKPPTPQDWQSLNEVVYDLIVNGLLNVDDLLEMLNNLPGAAIAISIIQKLNKYCAVPPRFYPPLTDFFRLPGYNVDICSLQDGIVMNPPPAFLGIPKLTLAGLGSALVDNAWLVLKHIMKRLLVLVLKKILEIIFEELCKQRVGGDPLGLRDAMLSRCGDIDPAVLDDALADISGALGCLSDPVALGRFIDNISSVITECELVDVINGTASDNIYDIIIQIIKVDPLTLPLHECLNDKESITSFFKAVGVFIDLDTLCVFDPLDLPISQDVCDNFGLLNLFRETRAQALRDKGVDEECINDQLCKLRDRTIADLADVTALLQQGIFDSIMPDLVKDPSNPDKPGLLPNVNEAQAETFNSIYDSMFQGIAVEYTEDLIGRRGFLNMCLADSRGRGYTQHLNYQKMLGPSTFNIYGSRGTRAYPPRDEWGPGSDSPGDHNDTWVTGPLPFTEDAKKFIWMPYLFNPLSSVPDDDDETEIGDQFDGANFEEDVEVKGRPPAIGGLPNKVAGWLQTNLRDFSVLFSKDSNYSFSTAWSDYDGDNDLLYNFSYDFYSPPPEGRTPYDYDGYRFKISRTLDSGLFDAPTTETLSYFATEDPLSAEITSYIRDILAPVSRTGDSPDRTPADTWADFVELKFASATDSELASSPFHSEFAGPIFEKINAGFVNMLAKDVSKTDIFDYGYDRESIPEVIYFHDEEFDGDVAAAVSAYGGSEGNPPFYIKEAPTSGFLKLAKSVIPEFNPCEDPVSSVSFPDFPSLKEVANDLIGKIKDDKRLSHAKGNHTKIQEAPFERALPAVSVALNEALILATIRIYLTEFMLKAITVFGFLSPKYPKNYTNLFVEFVIDSMERGLKESGRGKRYRENNEDYWWLFLEQVVQTFTTKREHGAIKEEEITDAERAALNEIYPYVENTWTGENGYQFFKNRPKKNSKVKKDNWDYVMNNSALLNNCKVILRRYVGEEMSRVVPALEELLPDAIKDIDTLLLESPGRPAPAITPFGGPDVPYFTGALNSGEQGPVDVPGVSYHFLGGGVYGTPSEPHPLDVFAGGAFYDRDWPFVLERYAVVREEGLDARIYSLGSVTNIFDLQELTDDIGTEVGPDWYFGLRISYVPSQESAERIDFEPLEAGLISGMDFSQKAFSSLYKNLIPLVSVEEPMDSGEPYSAAAYSRKLQSLVCKLIETTEYKMLFSHCFPVARYMSYLAVYAANTFVPSLAKIDDGWAATSKSILTGNKNRGGGRWIGIGKFGGMRTWRGNEGMENSFHRSKRMVRQMLEDSCNTNYLYKDRDEMTPQEALIEINRTDSDSDPGIKWWQWSSLRPAPCKNEED